MPKIIQISLTILVLILVINTGLAWLLNGEPALAATGGASTASFLLLLPLGLILINLSADKQAASNTAIIGTLFVTWVVAGLAYFGAGFAFQFGGLAIGNSHPDFADLYWNWSPLDTADAPLWGVIGLRGWALLGQAGTPGVYDLFLRHFALVGIVTTIPAFLLHRRLNTAGLLLFGVLTGGLIYPLVGNWVWSSGWLSRLGLTLNLGHGFVDAGIATPFALAGLISLTVLLVFRKEAEADLVAETNDASKTMPLEYLPFVSLFGLMMVIWGWTFVAEPDHIPTAAAIDVPRAAVNGILAAFTGALVAALYSQFVTANFNLLMLCRGAVGSLVAVSTVAPFIPTWIAIVLGAVFGLLTPFLLYFVDHLLHLRDQTGAVALFGLLGILAWLLPGFLADGTIGAGWNNVGEVAYFGLEGQGVAGLLVAPGYFSDWPGQLNAQLVGAMAIGLWAFSISYAFLRVYRWLAYDLPQARTIHVSPLNPASDEATPAADRDELGSEQLSWQG